MDPTPPRCCPPTSGGGPWGPRRCPSGNCSLRVRGGQGDVGDMGMEGHGRYGDGGTGGHGGNGDGGTEGHVGYGDGGMGVRGGLGVTWRCEGGDIVGRVIWGAGGDMEGLEGAGGHGRGGGPLAGGGPDPDCPLPGNSVSPQRGEGVSVRTYSC